MFGVTSMNKGSLSIIRTYRSVFWKKKLFACFISNPEKYILLVCTARGVRYFSMSMFFEFYDSISYYFRPIPQIEMSSMSISQSVDAPLTTKDTAMLAGSLSMRNGNGSGSINTTFRRLVSHNGWAEVNIFSVCVYSMKRVGILPILYCHFLFIFFCALSTLLMQWWTVLQPLCIAAANTTWN